MTTVSIVGGGLAGLMAAVECAERGASVRLFEARSELGGRATTTSGPFAANYGPHAFYTGPLWSWLEARDLHRPFRIPKSPAVRFRWRGEVRRTPPTALLRGLRPLRADAPIDRPFFDWMAARADEEVARAVGNLAGPLTFDADPGRLSAAFVASRIRRILLRFPPAARYVVGGWGQVVDRLGDHARTLGVEIETGAKIENLDDLSADPVIVATAPRSARRLLEDDTFTLESPRVLFHDLGLEARRGDPYLVFDLDKAGFLDRFTAVDASLAPTGHSLIQAMIGLRPGEDRSSVTRRLEALLDSALDDWRDRVVWDRQGVVHEATGALDLPGRTWRDRTPVTYRPGVWLAGDWVTAPGHLSEVSHASAVQAATAALTSRPPSRAVS